MTAHLVARIGLPVLLLGISTITLVGNTSYHSPAAGARAIVIAGLVSDEAGAPAEGAAVMAMPWNVGAVTDRGGRYRILLRNARVGDRGTLTIQRLGYQQFTRALRITGDSVRIDVRLTPAAIALQELVVSAAAMPLMRQPVAFSVGGVAGLHVAAPHRRTDPDFNTEAYAGINENPFLATSANPLSTFSIDVDRASYANVRRFLNQGQLPPKDAVRIEELINYFAYDDPPPTGAVPFAVRTELAPAPWRPQHRLLRIALKARALAVASAPPGNFVFLIDVSGSMTPDNKLPLLKQAFGLLVQELRPVDRVALVVYAGAAGLVLESTPGDQKETILAAIERLEAGGSTAGGAGLRLAYDVARAHHVRGGNNRLILATDGDFNVGESSDAAMMRLVEERRQQGTFLTVLGFGMGNLKDSKLETLADRGNGNYAYIDDIAEARKVLVEELGGTLFTIAKDVKLQVEFNPAQVAGYRLIGYENRLLAAEDFNDDRKDAGELGAGHSVTALYEIVPVGVRTEVELRRPDSLRYQQPATPTGARNGELAYVKLRYKQPDGDRSVLLQHTVPDRDTRPTSDFTFSAAVASFGMILRDSPHRGETSLERVLAMARSGLGEDRGAHRTAFLELVEKARTLTRPVATERER